MANPPTAQEREALAALTVDLDKLYAKWTAVVDGKSARSMATAETSLYCALINAWPKISRSLHAALAAEPPNGVVRRVRNRPPIDLRDDHAAEPAMPEDVAELVRLGHQRYQDAGDTLARKSADMLSRLSARCAELEGQRGTLELAAARKMPREPTKAMLEAGFEQRVPGLIWRAMYDAASAEDAKSGDNVR